MKDIPAFFDKTIFKSGIKLIDEEGKMKVDRIKWNGLAKKDGMQIGDFITEFKIENLDRPNKAIVYPFALILLFGFGYFNYKRGEQEINE